MTERLKDKVVLLTGIGSGMGRETARLLASEGAVVVGCDINPDTSLETLNLIKADGFKIDVTTPLDLTDPKQVSEWIKSAAEKYGRIDVLYNNASLPRFGSFKTQSDEDYLFTIKNELDLVWYACKAAWPYLTKSQGAIVNIASVAGIQGARTLPQAAHSAAKGAVLALTRQLAAEGMAVGVRVNSVSPGVMDTPPIKAMYQELGKDAPVNSIVERTLTGKPGNPKTVAWAGVYLASDEASWVTGINIPVDGGASAVM
ncbi:SDR family oxidoreductase [Pseudomaricurvus alcaniphilus]|uniref:SDR family NAD(P)-dependent oxidoreductase n=1 Tax=Pseudomaricurvus alcaniphilus TaxID=1166482 RepID=UPI001409336B|nr:SDR family oxidoreductase [Pseudomaricurvus alcaniphilus]NHN39886.1 SDR family oxidoreductase [Pseudomaricurvus alcaniphilus]